mmetsp:Transcript_24988/g.33277  ORF Transcript_24988/g.33277 Transcript_24988/m.33277 type:complete len:82 (-) Transcript_24988:370-615(-)
MFRHPLELVTTFVFVVVTAEAVFVVLVVSDVRDLLNAKTFFGARSNGVMVILAPVVGHFSTTTPELSSAPALEELELEFSL